MKYKMQLHLNNALFSMRAGSQWDLWDNQAKSQQPHRSHKSHESQRSQREPALMGNRAKY